MSSKKTRNIGTEDIHNSSFNSNKSSCIICLDEVRCRGKLSVCKHWFCYACILEWSKNTNTCPVCKTRFRSISKVHLSPLKSPPTKVRVPDRDQRVWNDEDDDGITEEMLFDIQNEMREDMDDDYLPPNPWSRAHLIQDDLDEYDLEDSFIDDSNVSQPSSHPLGQLTVTIEYEEELITRNSPYMLRRRQGRRGPGTRGRDITMDIYALNNIDEDTAFEEISSDDSCDSSSEDSSFIDDDEDEENGANKRITRQMTRASRRSGRNTRSQAKVLKEQVRNEREIQDHIIAQNIQETGSSGWLSTRRTNDGAATRVTAQVANQNSPTRQQRGYTTDFSHRRARDEQIVTSRPRENTKKTTRDNFNYSDDTDDYDYKYDYDENEDDPDSDSPISTLVTRARNRSRGLTKSKETYSRSDTFVFSQDQDGPSSESGRNINNILRYPRTPPAQQKTVRRNKSPVSTRNSHQFLEDISADLSCAEENYTMGNSSEEKRWKRIRNGRKGKGKENVPLTRSISSQSTLGRNSRQVREPGYVSESSTKRPRRGIDNYKRVSKRQKSSTATLTLSRQDLLSLEQDSSSDPRQCNNRRSLKIRSDRTSPSVNHRYTLRKHVNGNDDDDTDDDEYVDKRTRSTTASRSYDNKRYAGRGKRKSATASRSLDYKDDDDDVAKKYLGKGKGDKAKSRSKDYINDAAAEGYKNHGKGNKTNDYINDATASDDYDDKYVDKGRQTHTLPNWSSNYKNVFYEDQDIEYFPGLDISDCKDDSSNNEDEKLDIIVPTPQPDKKRSLFTRRQHRPVCQEFEDTLNEQQGSKCCRPPELSSSSKLNLENQSDKIDTKTSVHWRSSCKLLERHDDFTPEPESSINHPNKIYTSTVPRAKTIRRRIKVYDSDSD